MAPFARRWKLYRHLAALSVALTLVACGGATETTSSSNGAAAAAIAIGGTPTTAVAVGSVYSFQPSTSAAAGTIGYSIQNMPSWATFSTVTGQLLGTPTAANVGTYQNIVISASNGSAKAALPAFSVTVTQASASVASNSPGTATLNWSPPTTNTDGTPFTDLAGFYIYYGTNDSTMTSLVNDETGGANTGSFTVTGLAPGTYYFQVSAYSALGVQSAPSNEVAVTVASS